MSETPTETQQPEESAQALQEDNQAQTDQKKRPKKRRWLRRLIWIGLLLLLIGYLINGIVARLLITELLDKATQNQNMLGSASIEGSLLSGFHINDADYSGQDGVQTLKIKKAAINYDLKSLAHKKINLIEVQDATIKIDIAKFAPSKKKEATPERDLKSTLDKIRPWFTQSELDINNIDLTILKDDEPLFAAQLGSLSHKADSDQIAITSFSAQNKHGQSTPNQDTLISWQEESLAIDQFELLPHIAISNGHFSWADDPKGTLTLQLHDALIDLKIAQDIELELKQGNVECSKLIDSFGIQIPVDFSLHTADATISHWKAPIAQWTIDSQLGIKSASYEQYKLTESAVKFHQKDSACHLDIDTKLSQAPLSVKVTGQWQEPTSKKWWGDNHVQFELEAPALGNIPELWSHDTTCIKLQKAAVAIKGDVVLAGNEITTANLNASLSGANAHEHKIPAIAIESSYLEQKAQLKVTTEDAPEREFLIQANYNNREKTYDGSLNINDNSPQWLYSVCYQFNELINFSDEMKLTWAGNGSLSSEGNQEAFHRGNFNIEQLSYNLPNTPTLNLNTKGNYAWPNSIYVESLNIKESQWNASTSMIWDGQTVTIPALIFKNSTEAVLGGSIQVPLTRESMSMKGFFAQKAPWNIALKTQPLTFKKLGDWFNFTTPNDIKGTTDVYITLTGSPSDPRANGSANITNVTGLTSKLSRPISARTGFRSIGDKLEINADINEGDSERLTIKGLFPFLPNEWINQPGLFNQSVKSAPISGDLKLNAFPLAELKEFVPTLESIEGNISGQGVFSGTWSEPIYKLDIQAAAPTIKLSEKSIGNIKDVQLKTSITQDRIIQNKLVAQINGGEFEIAGTIDINDLENPALDLILNTQYAMIYRDDLLSARTNAALKLQGTIKDATISGDIGIVETLIYKDIELIPIGVPSSEVAEVNLPQLSKDGFDDGLPIPAPFANWKLDVGITTEDPILLRGNVAQGNIQGKLKVKGNLANPEPDGTLYVNNMKARLPFSILSIDNGEINFTPKEGIFPSLKLLGKSSIGSHDVNLLIHGSVSSPTTSFTSSPPLPEPEIMSLLATGSTTAELANSDVAAFKALQLFLIKTQQRKGGAEGNKLFKLLLTGMQNLNLNVGAVDEFTGRKYASAKLDLDPRWHLTAQVDDAQRTRGLVVYVIRFR